MTFTNKLNKKKANFNVNFFNFNWLRCVRLATLYFTVTLYIYVCARNKIPSNWIKKSPLHKQYFTWLLTDKLSFISRAFEEHDFYNVGSKLLWKSTKAPWNIVIIRNKKERRELPHTREIWCLMMIWWYPLQHIPLLEKFSGDIVCHLK